MSAPKEDDGPPAEEKGDSSARQAFVARDAHDSWEEVGLGASGDEEDSLSEGEGSSDSPEYLASLGGVPVSSIKDGSVGAKEEEVSPDPPLPRISASDSFGTAVSPAKKLPPAPPGVMPELAPLDAPPLLKMLSSTPPGAADSVSLTAEEEEGASKAADAMWKTTLASIDIEKAFEELRKVAKARGEVLTTHEEKKMKEEFMRLHVRNLWEAKNVDSKEI